jgi:hypothetical protein
MVRRREHNRDEANDSREQTLRDNSDAAELATSLLMPLAVETMQLDWDGKTRGWVQRHAEEEPLPLQITTMDGIGIGRQH